MPETRFITILDFRTPWECDIEVLGQTFEIAIGGQTGKLTLPSLKSDEQQEKLERLLMSPPATLNWKQGGEPIYWGKVVYTQATVDCAVAEFLVETNYPEEIANSIYEAYTDWYALLAKYLMILTNSDCQVPGLESTNVDDPYGPYRIGAYTSEKTGRLKRFPHTRKKPIILYVDISGGSQIRFDHLAKACRLALSGLLPRLEYRLLIAAYVAKGRRDYRKAIIEACTAMEVSLTECARKKMEEQGITFREQLLQRFRMLGGRLELARIIGLPLPEKDYVKLVINPRNDVIHRADFANRGLANQVISAVKELLKLFSPCIHEDIMVNNGQ